MAARGRKMKTPAWAQEFAEMVWRKEVGGKLPVSLVFKTIAHIPYKCGAGGRAMYAWGKFHTIKVEVGSQCIGGMDLEDETRFVLLHELAHAMLPTTINHEQRFYKQAFKLYKKYLPERLLEPVITREVRYIPKFAVPAAKSSRLGKYIPAGR